MKTHFHIENKAFPEYLKVSTNTGTYYFRDDLTIEYDDREDLEISISTVRTYDYFKTKTKNPFLRLLAVIGGWLFSLIPFFVDRDAVSSFDKVYQSFDPFVHQKTFSIHAPDEKTVSIHYTAPKYNEFTKKYTPSAIDVQGDGVVIKTQNTEFSEAVLKQEWKAYHIAGYSVLLIIILLVIALSLSIFIKVITEIPLNSLGDNIFGIVATAFCMLVMIGLLIGHIIMTVKSCRLLKEVIEKNA